MQCIICGSDMVVDKHITWYYVCPNCKHESSILTNNSEALDVVALQEAIKTLRTLNFNIICKTIKEMDPDIALGLDVGSNNGLFLEVAKLHRLNFEGVEPDKKVADISLETINAKVYVGFFPEVLEANKVPADKFDIVTFNDVFEHFPPPPQVAYKALQSI